MSVQGNGSMPLHHNVTKTDQNLATAYSPIRPTEVMDTPATIWFQGLQEGTASVTRSGGMALMIGGTVFALVRG